MKIIVLCLSIMLVFTSCEDWLDVEPKTEIEVGTMFETEQGFKDALFGCYTLLSDADLYGAQMTCTFMDVLGQQYTLLGTTSSSYNNASRYIYTDGNCESIINGIWLGLYNTIANVNALIEGLEMQKDNLDPMFYALTKAEGYSLRAFIYLDLVRLFTWGNLPARPEKLQEYAIPYAKVYDKTILPQSKLGDVLKYIHEDLEIAISLFGLYDPLSANGDNRPEDYVEPEKNDTYYGWEARKYRMNIKAALAIRMRLNMWEGNYEAAYQDAKTLIDKYQLSFTQGLSDRDENMRDLTFSSEMLFGLETYQRFEDIAKKYFQLTANDGSNTNNDALCLSKDRLKDIYEIDGDGASDYRYMYWWKADTKSENYGFIRFWEYEDMRYKNLVPLIRPSEVYYTATECLLLSGNKNDAVGYINTVRNGRNIPKEKDLSVNLSQEEIEDELFKEWRKDFIGDGQMFYYYKRKGFTSIPNAIASVSIDDNVYVLPLPQDEVDFGGRVELIGKNDNQ